MKSFFALNDFYNAEGSLEITEDGYKNIIDLANIVLNVHYSYVSSVDREDLTQTGILKCLDLLNKNDFDASRSSLKNYLYTGVRNEMRNYLYRTSKEILVEDDILYGINESSCGFDSDTLFRIEERSYLKYFEKFKLTQPDRLDVLQSLKSVGFIIKEPVANVDYNPNYSKIIALIVWDHIYYSRR